MGDSIIRSLCFGVNLRDSVDSVRITSSFRSSKESSPLSAVACLSVCLGICFYRISDVTQAAVGGMADGNFRSFDRRRRERRGRGRGKEGKWSIPSSSIVNLEVVGSTRGNQSEKGFMSVCLVGVASPALKCIRSIPSAHLTSHLFISDL